MRKMTDMAQLRIVSQALDGTSAHAAWQYALDELLRLRAAVTMAEAEQERAAARLIDMTEGNEAVRLLRGLLAAYDLAQAHESHASAAARAWLCGVPNRR